MAITQPEYLLFVAVVVALFYAAPSGPVRIALLLSAGYTFYVLLSPSFWFVLLGVSLVGYVAGLLIERSPARKAHVAFVAGVTLIVLPLIYYKYAGFLMSQIDAVTGLNPAWRPHWMAAHVLLPIGISFYVFQVIGYVADVYLGIAKAEASWVRFSAFMAFFPILSAGPIERSSHLIRQFDDVVVFSSSNILTGLKLMLFGMALKFGIADQLATPVNMVFADLKHQPGPHEIWAAIYFSLQIYGDVYGYSLIAIGSAKLFGIDVIWNFRQPFLSTNIQEFWRCWHISLSNWLRDYLYLPMRASWRRMPKLGPLLAIIVTFLIAGIWHGAGWTYIVYGLSQGVFLAGSMLTLRRRDLYWKRIGVPPTLIVPHRILITFLMVTISLVFVRAQTFADALTVASQFFAPANYAHFFSVDADTFRPAYWICAAVLIGSDMAARRGLDFDRFPRVLQAAVYGICGAVVLYAWVIDRVPQPFFYYKY